MTSCYVLFTAKQVEIAMKELSFQCHTSGFLPFQNVKLKILFQLKYAILKH